MQTITSRTSNERILRAGLLMLLVDVFTLLFLWDGHIGYARDNAAELAALLGLEPARSLPIDSTLSAARGKAAAVAIRPGEPVDTVRQVHGEPAVVKDGDLYYVGPGGWLHISVENGRVRNTEWKDAAHSEADQRWQRWIGYALAILGLVATIQFAVVIATRATVSAEGVRFGARPIIPWDAITDLRAVPAKRGAIELEYGAGDRHETIRMDDYRYKDLPAITAAIAQRKNIANPLSRS